ncbi:MAG: serine/threonine-protein kinase [bacterium]
MQQAEIECQQCGVLNSSTAEKCGACGNRLYTMDATLQSGDELARTTPSNPGKAEQLIVAVDDAAVSTEDTIDGTILGRPDHTLIGTMVGEYRVSGVIGEGGMGTVFAGVHPLIGKEVAIKVLKPSLSDDPEVMERFLAEAKAVNTIQHPNIIDIFSFGQLNDESQYFVMEYVAGRSLAKYLKDVKTVGYTEALSILRQVFDALKAAHGRGIVHRDLKPDNIYLGDHPSGGFYVKLLDFGIAKFTEDGISVGHTRTGVPIGTPLYMSPEQCRGRDVDHLSDIYSLGVIMYEMFTGQPPFAAKTVYQLVNSHVHTPPVKPSTLVEFPSDLERIILWCLAKDKAARPSTAAELKDALIPVLEKLAAGEASAPTPMPALPENLGDDGMDSRISITTAGTGRTTDLSGRGRAGLFIVIGILIAAVAVAAVLLVRRDDKKGAAKPAPPPAAVMASPDAAPSEPKQDLVVLQFQVAPPLVKHTIYVNDKKVSGRLFEVPRHRTRAVKVKIVAPGYHTYEADWVPFSNLPIQVTLVKKDEPLPMGQAGHRRRRRPAWRPPPAMHDPRPVMRPTMGGFDMI